MSQVPAVLNLKEEDLQKLLMAQTHIGTTNLNPSMGRYVWKHRNDGVHILHLGKTWEKIVLAARVIAGIENPSDVCVASSRPYGQRAVLKFAHYTGAHALAGRYTPGTFTNQIQEKFLEPRLLIVTDPRSDAQPLKESSYVNIPVIAFCDTDSPTRYVDIAIPCNNKAPHSVGLLFWLLAREVLFMRKQLQRGQAWDVKPDLFFYREETEKAVEGKGAEGEHAAWGSEQPAIGDAPSPWEQKPGASADWIVPTGEPAAPVPPAAAGAAGAAQTWDQSA